MKNPRASDARRFLHQTLRKAFSFFPRSLRFAVYRSFVDCDPRPDKRLVLKIAETREELQACFKLLHDAYVGSGFMRPDPSGMRVTIYHALPTTTTLCAKYDDEVVGTISLIRESVFGFPLQSIFDLHEVREKKGRVAEVSALAVHPKFRNTGGTILFPLMKFMYEYCTTFFDTRHLVIAVNPNRIEMYESLLFFERLAENEVENYDFANGAPAVGASVDLHVAPEIFKRVYGKKPRRKNLYLYFLRTRLRNIVMPSRRYFTTNDPVMTPDLLDYFFNQCTHTFQNLNEREKGLLHSIYNLPEYKEVLPVIFSESNFRIRQRRHQRYSLKCPGSFSVISPEKTEVYALRVVEFSDDGFLAHSKAPLPTNVWGEASIRLGSEEKSIVKAMVVRGNHKGSHGFYGFKLVESDLSWRKLVSVLKSGTTHEDLDNATRFLTD
ncbi:GNAT family N-acetyltransferase [Rhodoferax sp. UBA5149]|uniref:GNAT family N-acetyltransferase n=1 Tax=Rhodoferax sp. UBA5149 TaxID=1947379 RepID=UPI0025F6920D|nr:GNAT family N-acetyltransferase [Rhodoferax sp. UBA5149]